MTTTEYIQSILQRSHFVNRLRQWRIIFDLPWERLNMVDALRGEL
jgi:hypothetical protein